MLKQCSRCQEYKDISSFYKHKSHSDGYCSVCKNCSKIIHQEYYQKNKDKIKSKVKQYTLDNKKKIKNLNKKYYLQHCDKIKQNVRKYNSLSETKEKIRNRNRQKSKNNIQFRLAHNLRTRIGKFFSRNVKNGSAIKDLGCSVDEFVQWIESQFSDGMSWENYGSGMDKWNIDHIIPLHMVDLTKEEDVKKVCHHTNLRPMWQQDNISRKYDDINVQ